MAVNNHLKLFATIASIVYFLLYVVMVAVLAIVTYKSGDYQNESKTTFLKAVWKKRSIYGQILVHIYDTATDFGVLIGWGILAYDDNNYESIDMLGLFWTSVGFLIAYRVLTIAMGCYTAADGGTPIDLLINCCFGMLDIYIFRIVYEALTKQAKEPSGRQKFVQLVESIFESLPQVVLQSVFIIRAQNDALLKDNSNIVLVGLSLGASLFSISNKFTWVDYDCVVNDAQEVNLKKSYPCVNKWYVLRVVWRYSFVTARFAVFSLMWSVMGGWFLGIFILVSWLYWGFGGSYSIFTDSFVEMIFGGSEVLESLAFVFMYGCVCLISTPACEKLAVAIMHGIEMILSLSIITWFAFDSSMDCGICASPVHRQASGNVYIWMFTVCGWVALSIDFVTYFLMLKFDRIEESEHLGNALSMFDGFASNKMET